MWWYLRDAEVKQYLELSKNQLMKREFCLQRRRWQCGAIASRV
jgi:hypothetical protein